nr:MAG TPA: Protein of unknown function DUF262 [Caudoviricetes sp.]
MSQDDYRQELAANGNPAGVEMEDDIHEFPFDADKITISSVPVPVSRLLERLKKETISSPAIQRSENLWTIQQQSRLIESLMLRIPLPLFYVAADNDENWKIVDGLQRVSALRNYLQNNNFTLSGLEFLIELNGFQYDNLPPKYQNRIMDTTLQFAVISSTTPPEVQRNIFKRLNTGGLPLSQQEIRHALYYDERVAELLLNLAESSAFQLATDFSINDSRMAARELVLRFIAFLIRDITAYPKNDDMDAFLSDTMLLLSAMPELREDKLKKLFAFRKNAIETNCLYTRFEDITDKFTLAMIRAGKLFGSYAFRKSIPPRKRTPINKALFETIAITLCELDEDSFTHLVNKKAALFEAIEKGFQEEIGYTISRDSHKLGSIKKRFNFFRELFHKFGREDNDSQALS